MSTEINSGAHPEEPSLPDRYPKPKEAETFAEDIRSVFQLLDLPSPLRKYAQLLSDQEMKSEYPVVYRLLVDLLPLVRRGEDIPTETKEMWRDRLAVAAYLNDHARYHEEGGTTILRQDQKTAFQNVANALISGRNVLLVEAPTGFGKTVLFVEIARKAGVKVLILAPKLQIVEQIQNEIQRQSSGAPTHETESITVNTIQAFTRGNIDPGLFGLIIVDEGHKALGPESVTRIHKIDDNTPVIVFTATPAYSSQKSVVSMLGAEMVHTTDTVELIKEGKLAPVRVIVAKTKVDLGEVPVVHNEYNAELFLKAVQRAGVSRSALELYGKAFPGQGAIGFCRSIKHAQEAAAVFREGGVTAIAVSGWTPKSELDEIIKSFRSGVVKVLFCSDLLIEGFDAPNASVVLNLAPTNSLVRAQQRGGRALRRDPDNPNKIAIVVEFLFNDDRAGTPQSVLYSHILGRASVLPSSGASRDSQQPGKGRSADLPIPPIENLKVICEERLVMEVTNEVAARPQGEVAPEGWLTRGELEEKLELLGSTLVGILQRVHRDKTSELQPAKFWHPESGRVRSMYPPALVNFIRAQRQQDLIDKGWLRFGEVSKQADIDGSKLALILKRMVTEQPDLVSIGDPSSKVPLYDPKVVTLILGMKTSPPLRRPHTIVKALASELRLPIKAVGMVAEEVRNQLPQAGMEEGCSEDFVEALRGALVEKFIGSFKGPNGEVTIASIAAWLGMPEEEIRKACGSLPINGVLQGSTVLKVGPFLSMITPCLNMPPGWMTVADFKGIAIFPPATKPFPPNVITKISRRSEDSLDGLLYFKVEGESRPVQCINKCLVTLAEYMKYEN